MKFSFRTEHTSVVMSYLICPSLQKQTFSLVCVFFQCRPRDVHVADLGVGPRGSRRPPAPPPPFCGLLNISALHFQYGIHVFAKFKRSECTRFHLRELQSQKFSRRSMCPKLPRKVRRSQSHIATVHYISRPPLSQNPPSAPV